MNRTTLHEVLENNLDKTGEEILNLFEKQRKREEDYLKLKNDKNFKIIEDIKLNSYFRGSYSTNQYFYYYITDIYYNKNDMFVGNIEKILIFLHKLESDKKYGNDLKISIDKDSIYTKSLELTYGIGGNMVKNITEEEYNKAKEHLKSFVPEFFKEEYEIRNNLI